MLIMLHFVGLAHQNRQTKKLAEGKWSSWFSSTINETKKKIFIFLLTPEKRLREATMQH